MPSIHSLHHVADWAAGHLGLAIPFAIVAVILVTAALYGIRRAIRALHRMNKPDLAVVASVVGALMCLALSLNTSWRFTAQDLDIHDRPERLMVVAIYETGLIALALLDRSDRLHAARPADGTEPVEPSGVPGGLLKLLVGFGVVPAFVIGGLVGGIARFIAVLLGLVLFHLAVGAEIKLRRGSIKDGPLAKVGRELWEWFLSKFGLGNEHRTAAELRRDRAVIKAARLAVAYRRKDDRSGRKLERLRKELRRAGVSTDLARRRTLIDEITVLKFAADLAEVKVDIPWGVIDTETASVAPDPRTPKATPSNATRAIERRGADNSVAPAGDNAEATSNADNGATEQATGNAGSNSAAANGPDNLATNIEATSNSHRVVSITKGRRVDAVIPLVREHGPDVGNPLVIEAVRGAGWKCDSPAATRLKQQAAAEIAMEAKADTEDASDEETG